MNRKPIIVVLLSTLAVLLAAAMPADAQSTTSSTSIVPANLPLIGTVDERYQSFNIEMVEVTGGRFWAPYKQDSGAPSATVDSKASTPAGMDPSLYRYRSPIDLADPKLRKLAAALAPAYVRVSGTWANTTFFQDSDQAEPASPPAGFGGVLTRKEWRGVIDFSHAVDAKIVTSFAIGAGVRDSNGVWTPVEAEKFLRFTKDSGGSIAAGEMFNEPSFASMGGAPKGYDAAAYGKDFRVFRAYIKKAAPELVVLGPGSVGEGHSLGEMPGIHLLKSEDILAAQGPGLDAFSYHFYGAVSKRCSRAGAAGGTTPEAALSDEWLSLTNKDAAFYAALRDRFVTGKPLWLTETGETACGGNPWASSFIDSFRYLNQLGTLAKRGVAVVMQNTLAASDYGLIDEATLTPRPNYWSALLWRRLMGTKVLDAGASSTPGLYLYAHCLRNQPGGVALLAINASRASSQELVLSKDSSRYALTSTNLLGGDIQLNGHDLKLNAQADLPAMEGEVVLAGKMFLPPASITFLAIPDAMNQACR